MTINCGTVERGRLFIILKIHIRPRRNQQRSRHSIKRTEKWSAMVSPDFVNFSMGVNQKFHHFKLALGQRKDQRSLKRSGDGVDLRPGIEKFSCAVNEPDNRTVMQRSANNEKQT
jgi:hypothetical protein